MLTGELSQVRTIAVDGSPPGLDSLATTLRGRVLSLASSPVEAESLYAVTRPSLIDLSSPEGGNTTLDAGGDLARATSADARPQARAAGP